MTCSDCGRLIIGERAKWNHGGRTCDECYEVMRRVANAAQREEIAVSDLELLRIDMARALRLRETHGTPRSLADDMLAATASGVAGAGQKKEGSAQVEL